jgi:4-amino-4-deoxy-L-arabinose transferase-like glycosyltransferase
MRKIADNNKWFFKTTGVLTILVLIAIVFRFHTFFPVTIDHDENTYAVIADHMLEGQVLYKDVIDIKQPGIFLIFAMIQLLFGKSILAIRLVAAMTIALSAYVIFSIKKEAGFSPISSLASAIVFVFLFNYYFGFSANAEVFFIAFSVVAFYFFINAKNGWYYFLSGLFYGLGFVIKQHILFDFAAIGIFFFVISIKEQKFLVQLPNMMLMVLSFLAPFLIVHVCFWYLGYYEYYHFVTYIAPGNYQSGYDIPKMIRFALDALVTYLPISILAIMAFWSHSWIKKWKMMTLLMLIMAVIGIIATGKAHHHYYLQLALPLSIAFGQFMDFFWLRQLFSSVWVRSVSWLLFAIYIVSIGSFYYQRYWVRKDVSREVIAYMNDRIKPNESIYAGDGPQILYWYFDKLSPTPYVHASLLLKPGHIQTLGIDVKEELDHIYAQYPNYIILSKDYQYDFFKLKVQKSYMKVGTVDKFEVYYRP